MSRAAEALLASRSSASDNSNNTNSSNTPEDYLGCVIDNVELASALEALGADVKTEDSLYDVAYRILVKGRELTVASALKVTQSAATAPVPPASAASEPTFPLQVCSKLH